MVHNDNRRFREFTTIAVARPLGESAALEKLRKFVRLLGSSLFQKHYNVSLECTNPYRIVAEQGIL